MEATWKAWVPKSVRDTGAWSLGGKIWRARRRVWPPRELILAQNFFYDAARFVKYSVPTSRVPDDRETLANHIVFHYHKLEKGLSLRNPRPGFGSEPIRKLDHLVTTFEKLFGRGHVVASARGAVRSVVGEGRLHGHRYELADRLLVGEGAAEDGGALDVTAAEVHAHSRKDLSGFFAHRFSVRDFSLEPVAPELIAKALTMAQKAPSVCNRQAARAYVFFTPEKKTLALSFQNGNRGFGHQAGAVIIIASDLRSFVNVGERNQCWVDGGLFAMSLNYALHSLGLGCCMLNWSMEAAPDRAMRKAMGIPDNEVVITMMAVGHLPERFKVALSKRRPLSEIARFDVDYSG